MEDRALGPVEGRGQGDDGPVALGTGDPSGGEGGTVPERFDAVVDRLGAVAGGEEDGVERLGPEFGGGAGCGAQQALSQELTTEEMVGRSGLASKVVAAVSVGVEAVEVKAFGEGGGQRSASP